ncbi:hypothetical protein AB0F25_28235 [Streptomyces wedmorensis]|uniref:hypothetical protein n=1 Tax=Streptomyces wedmorensis TaxID=43759 RepID=UPI0034336025
MSETTPALPAPTVAAGDSNVVDLADVQEGLSVTIPAYADFEAGDQVQVFWGGTSATNPFTVPEGEGDQPISLNIPRSTLEALGDGAVEFRYTVTDRAGNVSAPSEPITLTLTDQT